MLGAIADKASGERTAGSSFFQLLRAVVRDPRRLGPDGCGEVVGGSRHIDWGALSYAYQELAKNGLSDFRSYPATEL